MVVPRQSVPTDPRRIRINPNKQLENPNVAQSRLSLFSLPKQNSNGFASPNLPTNQSMSAAAGTKAYDETGAGGKFRRKPLRKSQATPYDRPPIAIRNTSSSGGGGNGWLSKIIDPASKLINASAHKLFGLAFRKRLLPPPQQQMLPPAPRQDASGYLFITVELLCVFRVFAMNWCIVCYAVV